MTSENVSRARALGSGNPQQREKLMLGGVLFVVALAAVLMLLRLRYGIDMTDESLYVAMSHRFANGDLPFANEMWIQQTASLLTTPFVWLWLRVAGSTAGVFLFTRILWYLLALAIATAVFAMFRRLLTRPLAILLAVTYVTFVPFGIPNLSYNTLSIGLLTIGLALLSSQLLDARDSGGRPFVAGVTHGLAVFAHPALLPAVCSVILAFALLHRGGRREVMGYLAGLGLVGCLGAALVVAVGPKYLIVDYIYTSKVLVGQIYLGGLSKVTMVMRQFAKVGLESLARQIVVLVFAFLLWDRTPWARGLLLLLPIVSLLPLIGDPTVAVQLWALLFGLPAMLVLLKDRSHEMRRLVWLVLPAALLAGAGMGYTSAQGLYNVATGVSPILLVALPLVFRVASGATASSSRTPISSTLAAVLLIAALVFVNWLGAYNSGGLAPFRMHDMVTRGPWKNMYGLSEQVELAEQMDADVERRVPVGSAVLFVGQIYGGYLSGHTKAAGPAIFYDISPREGLGSILRKYSRARIPDVVFVADADEGTAPGLGEETVMRPRWYLEEDVTYRRIVDREQYDVFERVR